MSAFAAFAPPLSQTAGYTFLCVAGALFAAGMWGVSYLLQKHLAKDTHSAEEFTASRFMALNSFRWLTRVVLGCRENPGRGTYRHRFAASVPRPKPPFTDSVFAL